MSRKFHDSFHCELRRGRGPALLLLLLFMRCAPESVSRSRNEKRGASDARRKEAYSRGSDRGNRLTKFHKPAPSTIIAVASVTLRGRVGRSPPLATRLVRLLLCQSNNNQIWCRSGYNRCCQIWREIQNYYSGLKGGRCVKTATLGYNDELRAEEKNRSSSPLSSFFRAPNRLSFGSLSSYPPPPPPNLREKS